MYTYAFAYGEFDVQVYLCSGQDSVKLPQLKDYYDLELDTTTYMSNLFT